MGHVVGVVHLMEHVVTFLGIARPIYSPVFDNAFAKEVRGVFAKEHANI